MKCLFYNFKWDTVPSVALKLTFTEFKFVFYNLQFDFELQIIKSNLLRAIWKSIQITPQVNFKFSFYLVN